MCLDPETGYALDTKHPSAGISNKSESSDVHPGNHTSNVYRTSASEPDVS